MLFKRRDPERLSDRIRVWLWPRRSWSRSFRYVKARVSRLRGTPHFIALGFVTGVFVSFMPYLGLHFIIAGLLAWLLGGSIIASALGTFFGNPLTFPLIWGSTYKLGNWLLGAHLPENTPKDFADKFMPPGLESVGSIFTSFDQLWLIFKPMTIGALPIGFTFALLLYYPVRKGVEAYQTARLRRITHRAAKLAARRNRRGARVQEPDQGRSQERHKGSRRQFQAIS